MKHQMCCVSLLAYLEGLHRLTFPDTHAFSLSSFERRVAAIERAVGGITAPPPHEAYSWNGIVWRLWRADLKTRGVADPELDLDLCGMAGMLDADYTTENLRRVVDRLGYDLPEIRCPREEDAAATLGEDCEACLLAVVQKLAYVGGRLGQRPPMEPLSRGTIYAFAAWLGEGFGLYGTAPTSRPEAPIWSTSSNAGRATAARGDIAREQACPNSACNGRCAAAGPEATLDDERHSVKTWITERLFIKAIPEKPHSIQTGIIKNLSTNTILKLERSILTSLPPPGSITTPAQGRQPTPTYLETQA
ncbi:hypothetical protein MY1884_002772 [Beauveria asiatica]